MFTFLIKCVIQLAALAMAQTTLQLCLTVQEILCCHETRRFTTQPPPSHHTLRQFNPF